MKPPRSLWQPALLLLFSLSACRQDKPLPPGNWLGRCEPSAQAPTSAHYGPPPTSFVSDKGTMFDQPFTAELEKSLAAFQRKSCHQLFVATVASLDGSTLETYALQYANRVGLGYRGLNNGVLLLLAPKTRQARIQIGCGLEDVISDKQAAEIMQRDLLPAFRDGDDHDGIRAALAALMALAEKKAIAKELRPDGCR